MVEFDGEPEEGAIEKPVDEVQAANKPSQVLTQDEEHTGGVFHGNRRGGGC